MAQTNKYLGQTIEEILSENKAVFLKKWLEKTLATYPEDAAAFYASKENEFSNPVGYTISREIEKIFDELLKARSTEDLPTHVDALVRIRAVQDYSPSGAVSFLLLLKEIIREDILKDNFDQGLYNSVLGFESKIDQLCLLAFDIYMGCREEVWDLKLKEFKNSTSKLLERAKMVCPVSDEDSEP